ncbi:hypothetical protein JCM19235_2281 [Vibrio maritimus]|uniref:Uncharacterized protein n=1 Tax=Vibrio maritimus TaxID=990268 RepID=A0A090RWA4_9VIBR|nr:hypothetical protein JCM19235_2281 [Vibrio maritimus]
MIELIFEIIWGLLSLLGERMGDIDFLHIILAGALFLMNNFYHKEVSEIQGRNLELQRQVEEAKRNV